MKIENENQLMNRLGIENWRYLSKDKVTEFVSMMPDIDKEVMFKIIKQFPEFSKFGRDALNILNESTEQLSKSNSKDSKEYLEVIKETQSILKKELDKNNIDSEERKYIIEQIMKIAEIVRDMEEGNKSFLNQFGGRQLKAISILSASALTILGGRAFINKFTDKL
ncbi:MAG: hypothetical protein L0I79_05455 [Atopostipes sp.]|nr:hypothetical protein [Atopostipes sp.]